MVSILMMDLCARNHPLRLDANNGLSGSDTGQIRLIVERVASRP